MRVHRLAGQPERRVYRVLAALLLVVLMALTACSGDDVPEEEIIARVGDRIITAAEFRYAFEFSFAPLRQGPDPRRTFLGHMLKERALSLEGYRRGFDKSRYVQRRMRHRRYNNLLEAFYVKHVHGRVKIPEEALREATKKSTVKWRMRIWPTPSLEDAEAARAEAQKGGLEEYMKRQFEKLEVPIQDQMHYETDWIDYLEIRPELLEGIKNLEIGEISEPLPFDGGYALVEITDIQLQGIKEEDLQHGAMRKRIETRLRNVEADRIVHALMDSILTPMDVRVKGNVVGDLAGPLYKWVQDGLPRSQALLDAVEGAPDTAKSYLFHLQEMLNETLVTSTAGKKTVRDYLNYMDYFRRALKRKETREDFEKALVTEIGRMMKNDTFVRIAREEGFEDSTVVAHDLDLWRDKWTYDAYRHHLVDEIKVTEEELEDYFKHRWRELDIADVDTTRFYKYRVEVHAAVLHEKHIERLKEELARLKERYPVWINEKRLDELELLDDPKSRQISVFLIKRFTHKQVYPPVDMNWLSF